jgi:dTDP-4-dehydrorhamnose 3,5-epimerase
MKVTPTKLPGILIIEPVVFGDARGYFKETFSEQRYMDEAGISLPFVQDNYSRSERGVLRGLHFQKMHPQGKLVSVLRGAVFDVAVDIDPQSATFGQHLAVELTEHNHRQMWIPPGYAHGFCVISETADIVYKCTDYYRPEDEGGLAWDCPALGIEWPVDNPTLSKKDQEYPGLKALFPPSS